jgi:hypothetical protein
MTGGSLNMISPIGFAFVVPISCVPHIADKSIERNNAANIDFFITAIPA